MIQKKNIKYPGLLAEMAKRGEDQGTLAKLLISTRATISRKLAGKNQWSIDEIDKICEYYGKDYYQLFK